MSNRTNYEFIDADQNPFNQILWGTYFPDEIAKRFYNYCTEEIKNTVIITETKEENADWAEVLTEFRFDNDRSGEGDEDEPLAFTLKIYISKNGAKLIDEHKACKLANDREIVLFLEDNTGDKSAPFYGVKMGAEAQKVLQEHREKTNRGIRNQIPDNVNIDDDFLNALLRNKPLDAYQNLTTYDLLGKVVYNMNIVGSAAASGGIFALDWVIKKIKEKKLTEETWLPSKKKEGGLFDFIHFKGPEQTSKDNQSEVKPPIKEEEELDPLLNKMVDVLRNKFIEEDKAIKELFKRDLGVIKIGAAKVDFINDNVEVFVADYYLRASNMIYELFDKGNAYIVDLAKTLYNLGDDVVIAFFSGLYNSILEAISGILTIVKWIFQAVKESGKLLQDVRGGLPKLLEVLDNVMQAISNFDFASIFPMIKKGLSKIWQLIVKKFSGDLLDTMCIISYISGNIVGFIIELLAEALLTGGVGSAVGLMSKLGNIGKIVANAATSIFKLSFKKVGQSISDILQSFVTFLNQSKEKIQQFIDEVVAGIGRYLDEVGAIGKNLLLEISYRAWGVSRGLVKYLLEKNLFIYYKYIDQPPGLKNALQPTDSMSILYKDQIIWEGTQEQVQVFMKGLDDKYKGPGGKKEVDKKLDELDDDTWKYFERKIASGLTFETKRMEKVYTQGSRVEFEKGVKYLDEIERKKFEIFVQHDRLVDAQGKLIDTRDSINIDTLGREIKSNKANFVMSKKGNIYISYESEYGKFHHSSFVEGNPVAAAGEIIVENGVIKEITSESGHYRATIGLVEQNIVKELSNREYFDFRKVDEITFKQGF